jgi:DNA repair protein RecO (recombination protein O)
MALHYRTQGIILRKYDVGEADRIFVVFTKDFGKLSLRAISERKISSKLRSGLELFYVSEMEFIQGKSYKTITDAIPLATHSILRSNLECMRAMQRFAELADELLKGEEQDKKLWTLFLEVFEVLNNPQLKERELDVLAYYFLWKLLAFAGYGPSLQSLEEKDKNTANFINMLLKSTSGTLSTIQLDNINEERLREISKIHLSEVLQN